ncbi:MAG: hypothetical protein EKK63_02460 [Acinetobacter sp.]|uniref:hypothetical protein n=1 Tax=Acinetobacter sp. TaxID=472 RepID=UPI000F9CAB92|nr:hypothetical protein [Acinetobacter sp.]RUP42179.1 MAG: hypothetical protein EKK63_02460 [Acinetobacter sp.]
MMNADLLAINPKVVGEELKMEVRFSQAARWTPRELLKAEIGIHDWLRFLDDCFKQFEDPTHPLTPGFFTVEVMKSQYKLIGGGTHSFVIPKSKWKPFIEEQAEKLYLSGIIFFDKTPETT